MGTSQWMKEVFNGFTTVVRSYNWESAEVTLPCEPMKDEHQCSVSCMCAYIHTYMPLYVCTYVRTYVHMHMRTYVHMHMRTIIPHSKHA